jgi:integrase
MPEESWPVGDPFPRFQPLHTASLLLAAGVHPKIVQERLEHSQIGLIMDTYSHTIPAMQGEAAAKIRTVNAK